MGRRRFPTDLERTIVDAYEGGASSLQLAETYECHPQIITAVVRRSGGVIRGRGGKYGGVLSCAQKQEMARAYESGTPVTEIASGLGVTVAFCNRMLRRLGVPPKNWHRRTVNHDYFASIDTPEKARWLGYLSADATIHCRSGQRQASQLIATIQAADKEYLESFRQCLSSDHPINDVDTNTPKGNHKQSVLTICSARLCSDLVRCGVTPKKSLTIQPWNGPPDLMRFYWAGWIDGDGWIIKVSSGASWVVGLGTTLAVTTAFAKFVTENTGSRLVPRPNSSIWVQTYGGVVVPQRLATLFYSDLSGSVPLLRKYKAAQLCIEQQPLRVSTDHTAITKEAIRALRGRLGAWRRVASALRVSVSSLYKLLEQRGVRKEE